MTKTFDELMERTLACELWAGLAKASVPVSSRLLENKGSKRKRKIQEFDPEAPGLTQPYHSWLSGFEKILSVSTFPYL